jgi:alpha-2-macroglobulin
LVLNALIESQPNHPQVYELAKSLSKDLKNNPIPQHHTKWDLVSQHWVNSASKTRTREAKRIVLIDQKQVLEFTGKNSLYKTQKAHNLIQIKSTGTGNVFYTIVTEGIGNGKNYTEEDKGLTVRRTFLNRYGSSINQTQIKQNDLVIVKINISRPYGGGIRNIAITDILPAGLEIENPRITATKELSWMKNQSYPSYMDVRDDRINFFLRHWQQQNRDIVLHVSCCFQRNFCIGTNSSRCYVRPKYPQLPRQRNFDC